MGLLDDADELKRWVLRQDDSSDLSALSTTARVLAFGCTFDADTLPGDPIFDQAHKPMVAVVTYHNAKVHMIDTQIVRVHRQGFVGPLSFFDC